MFIDVRTSRLLLRSVRRSDAARIAARRSDPETARYQSWTVPYPLQEAEKLVTAVLEMEGPRPDEWYMLAIAHGENACSPCASARQSVPVTR